VKETAAAARAYFDKRERRGRRQRPPRSFLETLDDGFEPKRSVENAKKLIDEKGVLALFLFRGTANAEAMMPVIAEKKTVLFAGVGSSIKMHEPMSRYLFNLRAPVQTRGHQRGEPARLAGHQRRGGDLHRRRLRQGRARRRAEGVRQEQDHAQGGGLDPARAGGSRRRGGRNPQDQALGDARFCIPKICATIVKKLRAQGSLTQFYSLSNTSSGAYVTSSPRTRAAWSSRR